MNELQDQALERLSKLARVHEGIKVSELARIETASPGDVVRTGDVYFVCLHGPTGGQVTTERKLVTGVTKGSEHYAVGDCVVRTGPEVAAAIALARPDLEIPELLVGPSIECRGETTAAHPDHAHRVFMPDTSWGVVYQRKLAEEVKRIMD